MKSITKLFRFRIRKMHLIGIAVAVIIAVLSFIFLKDKDMLYFILGISFLIGGFPFFLSLIFESNLIKEKDEMFLEFSRDLVESVRAGTPISRSILNIQSKDYGSLNPYIEKLSNQISLGIPLKSALETFARDIGSQTITRAVTIISESEKAGGQIEDILEAVTKSVAQIEKLKKERTSAMYSLVMQGYIIFFIFIVIMLVMQFKILPIASGLGEGLTGTDSGESIGGSGIIAGIGGGEALSTEELVRPFLWLIITQGFFAGLVIGKLSEGSVISGLKHSFILVIISLLINTGAKVFIG